MIHASSAPCREEYVFAVTARDPASITIGPAGQIKITNRLNSAEGYLGVFQYLHWPHSYEVICQVECGC